MGSTTDFRPGLTIRWNNERWTIVEFQHVNPGNWRAFVRAKMKNLKTGRVVENRFRAGESVDVLRIESGEYQYLYRDSEMVVLMENETYDQINVPFERFGEQLNFMKEGTVVTVAKDGDEIISVEIPITAELKIIETPPGVKGDTATGGTKPAKLETGASVNVPLFLSEGEVIKVDTRTGTYIERVK